MKMRKAAVLMLAAAFTASSAFPSLEGIQVV